MKLGKIRIAMLSVGDQQYPQDQLGRVIQRVRDAVASLECVEEAHFATIMNDADATRVETDMKDRRFDAIIVNYVSWHITPFVMRTLKHFRDVPVLVWGIGGITGPDGKLDAPAAAAGVTAIVPLLKQMGYRYEVICEKPDEALRIEACEMFLRQAAAAKAVRNARIGLVGYADMGLYSCAYDKTLAFDRLGVDIEDYYSSELLDKMNAFTAEEVAGAMEEIKRDFTFTNAIPDKVLDRVTRLYLAMAGKRDERGLDAISIKCVNGVTQMGFNPCLAQTLLADKDTSVICECDAYGMLTGIMFSRATGQTSAFVENYEVFDETVLVGVCGFIPRDFIDGDPKIRSANLGEFNTGISNVSRMKTGRVTYGRLYQQGDSYRMFLSGGEALPNPKWTESGWAEPTPDFPSVLLKPGMPVQTYLENVPGQHIIMVYGDHVQEIKLLCRLLGVEVDSVNPV